MDRQADTLTIIASVRPETTAQVLDNAADLNIFFHVSRSIVEHGAVIDEYRDAVEELKNVFVNKIAMRHVKDYGPRLARSGQSWTSSTPLPMTAAARARMQGPAPHNTPSSRTVAAKPGPSAHMSPRDAGDMFSPRALRGPPPRSPCDACHMEPGEPDEEEEVIHARARVSQLSRTSVITGFSVQPQLPAELALQIPDVDVRSNVFSMLQEADGDAKTMLAVLQSLSFCDRHAFKLVAAAAEDLAHGLPLYP